MEDLDASAGDNNKTQSLKVIYGYEKTPVTHFQSMAELFADPHLGGFTKLPF